MHESFHYATIDDVQATARTLGAELPLSKNTDVLFSPLNVAGRTLHNRFALQPMEGTDGTADGSPTALTFRRYRRFAEGGAALIWFEAVATAPEIRASAHQLWLTETNLDAFKRIVDETKEAGLRKNGYAPLIVMQATNSGRYSKPDGTPHPLIAYNNPLFEDEPLPKDCILTDDQLRGYEALFGSTAKLARAAGFDGMDVKCCHRYLACELLSAYTRDGEYGGSFENRTRFLCNAYAAASAEAGDGFFLTSRLNAYDGFAYPYGFGVQEESGLAPRLDDCIELVKLLKERYSIPLIDITIGNPYKNPHVNRPYDHGGYVPPEHPLTGVKRLMDCVSTVQKALPTLPVIGSGFSYLRQFSPQLAAGMVESGGCAMAGFGRMAFAYPDFVNDLRHNGKLDEKKVCVTCGRCAALLRAGITAGCAVRDEQYRGIKL